ncbi:hypothetical protein ACTOB_003816 [Actinoplanes oblitus]|uniref:Uncharacterized protein n=1 Tax=Actinoplanes oblitus TaxID=3040509 RepID=A0ABY8WTB9_9ACTN|nr:hypothetical protein [Actinoplanes oblitus]WIN00131.1 hypothetical protein ACTOB_003816 [Actinoplanes oblitus]
MTCQAPAVDHGLQVVGPADRREQQGRCSVHGCGGRSDVRIVLHADVELAQEPVQAAGRSERPLVLAVVIGHRGGDTGRVDNVILAPRVGHARLDPAGMQPGRANEQLAPSAP